jgi:hypothetical protein
MRRIDVVFGGAIVILALVLSGIVLGYIPGPWAPETVSASQ